MESVFSKLTPKIQKLLKSNNIKNPTEPQIKAIPYILNGENILLIAPTGLGKTESALLPVFNNFLKSKGKNLKNNGISILYITPLRALNRDMLIRTIKWGNQLGIDIAVRHGDTSKSERARQSKYPPDMLITTPETLQILFIGKRLRKHLQEVHWVIIDEVHDLANSERGAQLSIALERLNEVVAEKHHTFQRIGLSATIGSPDEVACFLGGLQDNKFRKVTILDVDVTKHIELSVEIPFIKKEDYEQAKKLSIEPISYASLRKCEELINKHISTLLFINTRDGAEILASRFNLMKDNTQIGIHHGSLSKNARIESEENFKNGRLKALICTSSLELGIDVGKTDFVIQYNSPRDVTRIIQRIGRSGHRVGKISKGIIISNNPEDLVESLVIARRTLIGELEVLKIRQNPLSVLSNQIMSITLEYRKIRSNKIFRIIKRAYPFHTLKKEIFTKVIEQLHNQRNIWIEDVDVICSRRNTRNYFLDNISMIPDEKTYMAVDISSRNNIGKLDESFVLNYGLEGAKFILHGMPWKIVKKEEDEILITQTKEIGEVPSWIGEDIPIPFDVALEVGKLRRLIDMDIKKINYPCTKSSSIKIINQLEKQKQNGFVIPDDKVITIEVDNKIVVINACFGTKVNETIGRILSAYITQSIGESVGVNSDAYRISLELPVSLSADKIKNIFFDIKPESLWYLLNIILRNSTYIRWQLIHTARKFGAISKDFDYKNVGIKKLLTIFENSLIFDEAIDNLLWKRMDHENTKKVLEKIQNGEIKIVTQRLSPMALAGIEKIRGLMVPQRADRSILMALQKRINDADITLICTNCNNKWNTSVGRADTQPKCSKCNAIKIAAIRRYNSNFAKILIKKDLTKEEKKGLKRLHKNASLVLNYGRIALIILMGRGIGPDTAARILSRYNRFDLEKSDELQLKFLRDILKAELNYARTRGFWDH